ncbi:AAA family ATPase [Clostridium swellfunianum]|uniref:AAA family ATPase n=1 Tax=Clostridium swellfunianum TaxID=1367462 RepID=UPI00202FF5C4|nr:AAA family ATPase [Clostridium swellfunianum]MCM0650274.1 AAA family ATPase [Clostridium swellfunianum]
MIIWINGAFGSGKTQTAFELQRRTENSYVYDPENLGFFISKNMPSSIKNKEDFQDYEVWRELNFSLIKYIEEKYEGILIIPMTVVNPKYFNEIVGYLRNQEIIVKHYTLMASKATLLKRLKRRGDRDNSWGAQQIDRCLENLTSEVFQTHINTENMSIDEVVEKVAEMSNIKLLPDEMGKFKKNLFRIKTQLKHVRLFSWRL